MADEKDQRTEEHRRANAEVIDAAGGLVSILALVYSWFVEFDFIGFAFSAIAFVLFGFGRYFRFMDPDRKRDDKNDED